MTLALALASDHHALQNDLSTSSGPSFGKLNIFQFQFN